MIVFLVSICQIPEKLFEEILHRNTPFSFSVVFSLCYDDDTVVFGCNRKVFYKVSEVYFIKLTLSMCCVLCR